MSLLDHIIKRCNLSETKERILRNLFWAVLGKVVTLLGALLVGILVARYLGADQFGLMNYVISYVALFQIVASFGLDNIEIREEARHRDDYECLVGTAFTIKIVLAFITILLCVGTSLCLETDRHVTWMVALYSVSMIAQSFNVTRNYFMAIVDNEMVVKSEIVATVAGVVLKVALLLGHFGVEWFIAATMIDVFILAAGYTLSYQRRIGPMSRWTFSRNKAVYLMKEAYPILLTSAAVLIYQRIDQVMIGQLIDNKSVGLFSVAARVVELLIYVPFVLADTISPVLVAKREVSNDDYVRKAQTFMNIAFWLTLILAILTSQVAYWLILLLFGQQYEAAVPVLQILTFKAATVALSSCAGRMLVIEGLQRWAVFRDLLGCLVCVILNYYLLPLYGVVAAAVVAILSNLTAGYLADAIIPAYRHLFVRQTKAIFMGWKDLAEIRNLKK